jgi:hypothetical protein
VEAALDHRFAHVAALALTTVATPLAAPLPERLLALAGHRASPVRLALVEVLRAKPNRAHQTALVKLAGDDWAKSAARYGEDTDDYPIAHIAIEALLDLIPLGSGDEETLFVIATDTSDPDVRNAVFGLLAKSAIEMQKRLFDLAVAPGKGRVQSSAASALLQAAELIDQAVVDEITPRLLATRYEPVAGMFALLLGWRGPIAAVRSAAEELATNLALRAASIT